MITAYSEQPNLDRGIYSAKRFVELCESKQILKILIILDCQIEITLTDFFAEYVSEASLSRFAQPGIMSSSSNSSVLPLAYDILFQLY